ncbi:MAG: Gfo/Idh/MocA family oxidoreductase, partial [Gemmatimonadetes bacterium]|nr:Gfo/Idh/MocA family oxidoreductase [Gemmatimonadota bacterium]
VYVATPHPFHKDNSILCLEAGKAVLCEKPFTINAAEAEAVVACARANGTFLMEAMWSRYLPIMVQVRQWLDTGAIGEPLMVSADFGFRAGVNPDGRLFNLALGGGALLDIGIYVVSFAAMVLGSQPAQIAAAAHLGETGVDEQTGIVLRYSSGAIANLSCAIRASTSHEARIVGIEGTIVIDPSWWKGESATLKAGEREERIELPLAGNGYNYEAQEVARCLGEGLTESAVMSLDETVALMRILDEIRAQIGLKYPME